MGKQSRAKKSDNIGKGKVTPVQVAFIVDRYLSDNNYTQSRSAFRTEASSLIAKSPVHEAPRGLLSLGAMLNEYISLKEQKVMIDQERAQLEQEKWRIQTLLQGMQNVMNAYNAGPNPSVPAIQPATVTKSIIPNHQSDPRRTSPTGCAAANTPSVMPLSVPSRTAMGPESTPSCVTVQPSSSKRKDTITSTEAPSAAKRTRSASCPKKFPINTPEALMQSNEASTNQEKAKVSTSLKPLSHKHQANGLLAQGSSIAKRLFYPPLPSTPTKSSCPTTPPQALSSRCGNSISTAETSSTTTNDKNTPPEITPTHCTVVSYEKITVSPFKQMASYTIERSQCISSSPAKENLRKLNKRDHVKGRLDFDESEVAATLEKELSDNTSTSESDKDIDIFDLDFSSLEALGANFSFSELLVDLDLDGDIDYSCQPVLDGCAETISGLSSPDNNLGSGQFTSECSATVTEIQSEKDIQIQGVNNLMAVKSVTTCSIVSPAKNLGSYTYMADNCTRES